MVERRLRAPRLDLRVCEDLVRQRDVRVVLGALENVDRPARIARAEGRVFVHHVQPGLRPEDARRGKRIPQGLGDLDRLREDALGAAEIAGVDLRIREQHAEAQCLDERVSGLRPVESALEQGDRRVGRPCLGIRAGQRELHFGTVRCQPDAGLKLFDGAFDLVGLNQDAP